MTKQLIEFRTSDYSLEYSKIERLGRTVQRIADAIKPLELSDMDFPSLVTNPTEYLLRQMPDDFRVMARVVKRESLNFPEPVAKLIAMVEAEKAAERNLLTYASYFVVGTDGRFIHDAILIEKLEEMYSVYAESEIELNRLAIAKEFVDLFSKYQASARDLQQEVFTTSFYETLPRIVTMDGGTFRVVPYFVKKQVI